MSWHLTAPGMEVVLHGPGAQEMVLHLRVLHLRVLGEIMQNSSEKSVLLHQVRGDE